MPNYTPVLIGPNPPQGLPLAGTLTGGEMVPMDQPTGAIPAWLTCKASLTTLSTYFNAHSGSITSVVGTTNEIAVSTVAGVATVSFAPNIVVPAPASGTGLIVNGAANSFTAEFISNHSGGTSGGVYIQAGSNNTDYNTDFVNYNGTVLYGAVVGDGGLIWGGLAASASRGVGTMTLSTASSVSAIVVNAGAIAAGAAAFQSNVTGGGAAFYNSDILNSSLTMNANGANYGTIGNTGTQTWGLGSSNTVGSMASSGSLALQWNNGGSGASTVQVGPGTFTSTGSTYQGPTRATLMLNGTTDALIDFSVNGSTQGYIYCSGSAGYMRLLSDSSYISFWASTTEYGRVVASGNAGFMTVGAQVSYQRDSPGSGYLDGNYSGSGAENANTCGAIYSIGGGSYKPGTTTLGTMYGVGYAYSGGTALGGNPGWMPANTWGFYVTQAGASPGVFLASPFGAGGGVYVPTGGSFYINGVAQLTTGTFTATYNTVGASPTGTAHYSVAGSSVTITWPAVLGAGTAGSTTLSISGIPAALQPARSQFVPIGTSAVESNGVIPAGGLGYDMLFNAASGTVNIYQSGNTSVAAGAGNRGFATAISTTYQLT